MEEKRMKFGMLDSPSDERDHVWANICGLSKEELPKKFLNKHVYVKDQGNSMKCVGFAASSLMESIEMMRMNQENIPMLSAQFIYYNSGNPNENGTTPRDALTGLKEYGVCKDSLCPISVGDTLASMPKPSKEAYEEAKQRKIDGYAQVTRLEDIKKAVVKNGGCLVSMLYYADMLHPQSGYIGEPTSSTKLGNHFKLISGYDDDHEADIKGKHYKGFFVQLNSYGENQGVFGLEYVPYDMLNWVGGKYQYSIDKIFREAWAIYDDTQIMNDRFHYNAQDGEVIAKPKPINITLKVNVKVATVNGENKTLDASPILKNNTTFLPIRFVAENMGCKVDFKKINDRDNVFIRDLTTARKVDLLLGATVGYVDGKEYVMLQAPYIDAKSGRTLVPVRAVAEMLGCNVEWIKDGTIKITR
ncbi:MAG: stalk domain-containing protein [Cellulosilyticaceae bacterium]